LATGGGKYHTRLAADSGTYTVAVSCKSENCQAKYCSQQKCSSAASQKSNITGDDDQ